MTIAITIMKAQASGCSGGASPEHTDARDPAALRPDRIGRRRHNTIHDDNAHIALGMKNRRGLARQVACPKTPDFQALTIVMPQNALCPNSRATECRFVGWFEKKSRDGTKGCGAFQF
ncbi:hypothetical protein [Sagittula stellata]|uniref:hypothetical protein n=1 Tax=Sagittula stellata TaxID=52603 RepID=UPI0018DDB01C|nr:hypothetical protein [Sagittula stellata]